jgi:hypothetical protein
MFTLRAFPKAKSHDNTGSLDALVRSCSFLDSLIREVKMIQPLPSLKK